MAVEAFLKCDIKGESVVSGFEDQIDILDFRWGVDQTGTTHLGSGGAAGKANVHDATFTHYVDAASPNIFTACASGKHLPEVEFCSRKAGGDSQVDFLKIKMKDVIITNTTFGGTQDDERYVETFSLNFAEYEYKYQAQDNKGGKKGGEIVSKGEIAKGTYG